MREQRRRSNSAGGRFIERLFRGLDEAELCWLLSSKINSCVSIYSIETQSVSFATTDVIPWPVLFLLGYRNKKHSFFTGAAPKISQVSSAVVDAVHKLKWRHHFASLGEDSKLLPKALRYKRKTCAFTLQCKSPDLNMLCKELQKVVHCSAARSIAKMRGRPRRHGNTLPIEKAAHEWIRCSNWAPVPSDKNGGYVLVNIAELVVAQRTLLAGPWYRPVAPLSPQMWKNSFVPSYVRICREVVAVDDRINLSLLLASLDGGLLRMHSFLIHTVKDHKDPGEVVFRAIHSSSGHAFTGLMSWMNLVMDDVLRKFRHILTSCDGLLHDLKGFVPVKDMILVHFDLKDFFMQGSPAFLAHHASLMVPVRFRRPFRAAVLLVLENQYVCSRLIPGELWQVITGAGMGLRCSSSIADLAFLHSMELMGLGLATRRTQEISGIRFYRRFRDNLLFFFDPHFIKINNLVRRLKAAHPYTGKVEEASTTCITFLDVQLFIDLKAGIINYCPHLKPTALRSVLSIYSGHPSHVHGAWLKAYMLRIRKRASSVEWYVSFKDFILQKLCEAGVDRTLLAELDEQCKFTYPVPITSSGTLKKQRKSSFWLVLPFHPVWHKDLNRDVARLSRLFEQHNIPGISKHIGVSWSLRSPSLASSVIKY